VFVGAVVQVLLCCSCLIDALFSYSYNAAAAAGGDDGDGGCHGDGDDAVIVSCVYISSLTFSPCCEVDCVSQRAR